MPAHNLLAVLHLASAWAHCTPSYASIYMLEPSKICSSLTIAFMDANGPYTALQSGLDLGQVLHAQPGLLRKPGLLRNHATSRTKQNTLMQMLPFDDGGC